ncbi:MAG: glycosyltransferase family 4 protein [Planctomycetaceae bacterium]|nr:glycosyltransferase family 4 protein [Planctomycetaceae bacterium]MDC0273245.1 glycosyltransferase family 4 protein [Planctomycetaceae bacterium]MDG2387940.1 glycosyltransferase family 4 protein [Planctomycetaceae bacterium]
MKIAIVTAGGAGMFCGSCMHDNTWAKGLHAAGHDVTLLPTYTPIRVDEENLSSKRVFLGGINIYMESKSRLWHRLPRALTRWLDHPRILKMASKMSISNDAKDLGELTLASLQGTDGPQNREVDELINYLCDDLKPDIICFSNILQTGVVKTLRKRFNGKIYCVLQGDDIFLKDLPEPYQSQAVSLISDMDEHFDGYITHSDYYRDFMSNFLSLPVEKFHRLPLGIELSGLDGKPGAKKNSPLTIGYFARICPEKGFHHSLEAFRLFHAEHSDSRLLIGGYLGSKDQAFYEQQLENIRELGDAVQYIGSPTSQAAKVEIYKQFDLFSMPTTYHEPKGLPVLEAWANGIPVIQPNHGAFPEMIERTNGGLLVTPDNPQELANAWLKLAEDEGQREEYSHAGHRGVHEHFSIEAMVSETIRIFSES